MWEQIRANRRRSGFVVAVMGVVLVATGIALGAVLSPDPNAPFAGAVGALVLWLVLWIVAAFQGDRILLAVAGAHEIQKTDHPELFDVVEEMTIAALLPQVPRVYIVDDASPNAFATGVSPKRTAVTVTTGLLALLDRDELQGVVGHEVGHVKNRDVALMSTAGIMLGAIVLLADVGRNTLRYGGGQRQSRSDRDRGGGAALVVVALVLVVLAPILAQLLYLALSRRREYLADASSAIFTRYPEGLASALEKLGGSTTPLAHPNRVTDPMYIVAPASVARDEGGSWFSTHPPLGERIRILRGMAGGAGLAVYDAAFRAVKGAGVVGARTLAGAAAVTARGPSPAAPGPASRARQASDALLSAKGYRRVECGCGATVKLPPDASGAGRCPRCEAPLAA